ncbi:hypothetical protein AA313_de0203867 [Arthrobotrys entomopaga]|nr:hypothetical protein AA313_de0203867 [Arthrobotrys entomopaga]
MKTQAISLLLSTLTIGVSAQTYNAPTASCPATASADCAFLCSYPGSPQAGTTCSGVKITTEGAVCTACPGGNTTPPTASCPATASADCAYLCSYPGSPQAGTTCSGVNITTEGAVCTKCGGGSYTPPNASCPATASADCAFLCSYPGSPQAGTTCSGVKITTEGAVCNACPGGGTTPPTASCPATASADCAFLCSYPGSPQAGTTCSGVNITTEGAVCTKCGGGSTPPTASCPATASADCAYLCSYPANPQVGTTCSGVNITTEGSVCTKCGGGSTPPTASCPATYSASCAFLCSYPASPAAGITCSGVKITTEGAVCNACPGEPSSTLSTYPSSPSATGSSTCPADYETNCPYLCHYPSNPSDGYHCSNVNITTMGSVCSKCSGSVAAANTCPTDYETNCPYLCHYPSNPADGYHCSNVAITTMGSVCTKCSGTTPVAPPAYTGAASAVNAGSVSVLGFFGILFALF